MSSINDQGSIFIKVRELINHIRSTVLYNEKLNELKKRVEIGGEVTQYDVLVYDFDKQDFVIGVVTHVNDIESNAITLASVTVVNNNWTVVEKVF